MTSKRELKNTINYICSELLAECVAASLYNGKIDPQNAEALIKSILAIHKDYLSRVSHPEPGMQPKAYFRDLRESFSKQVNEVIDQICNLE